MDKKYGAFICTGCGIGDTLDIGALSGVVSGEMKMSCKTHEFLCGAEGRALIEKDINEEGVNSVVIGACSPRVMQDEFNFGGDKISVRANLREQVVWAKAEDAKADFVLELASDNMRMACAQIKKTELPEPYQLETVNKKILVVGGGVAGLTAAVEAAQTGYDVTIVEKSDALGGFAKQWRKQLPSRAPWTDLETPVVGSLLKSVEASDKITVKTGTEVARIAGAPGAFEVTFKPAGTSGEWDAPAKVGVDEQDKIDKGLMEDPNKEFRKYTDKNSDAEGFGSVILATGWNPADVSEYAHLGYGQFKNVVTNVEFEQLAAKGKIARPSDGKPVESVAFVQSPGGAEHDKDFPYCNSVTSLVALKQARYVREDNANAKAYILYQHMRTPGNMELFYKAAQNDDGVFLTKANVMQVTEESDGSLSVAVENTLLNENMNINVDMVVLAAGMVPTTKDAPIINLAYRQGPAFLDLDIFDGHADSHFICFPYETRRTGIYACGGVRKSMTVEETMDDATGAALKAIQCLESVDRGVAVHPRSGDKSYPEFFFQRCTQCKRCTEECPFGALDDDEKGTPLPNPTRCRRCGTCMGACPERIIGFKNYNVDMIGSMVKAIEVPDDDEEKLRILALVCENDAYPALDMAGMRRLGLNNLVRVIPVRCLGSVNMVWIKDAMSAGMDGAILLGCKYGDDYQCHFVKGSEIANKRMDNIGETLKSLGLETARVATRQIAISDYDKVPEIINEFVESIVAMGPNPFKGF
ncbi:MAG: heterodisulfide reductase subunit A [Deltaproteobacteria bacterium RIFOXYD12_FULL_57_12]|nr:MAG: heterodisulfide reductase subunit A [Deltaproteobacteria bacterium RIFOXYD12_FULL_57_12]